MLTVKLNELPLRETWTRDVPQQRAVSTFPFLGAQENQHTSVVYFELEPGHELGSHTDSAEEVLIIAEGKVEVTIGDESGIVEAPALALVPTMAPHNLRNIGDSQVRVIGVFAARDIVATFENNWLPDDTNVIDTVQILKAMQQQS